MSIATGSSINGAGYASFNLPVIFNNGEYHTKKDKKKATYLDRVVRYCREKGISYTEFQTMEYYGKIPMHIINELRGPEYLAILNKKREKLTRDKASTIAMYLIELEVKNKKRDDYLIATMFNVTVDDVRSVYVEDAIKELKRKKSQIIKW